MMNRHKLLALVLSILIFITSINTPIYAGNNDSLPSNPKTGSGTETDMWNYSSNYEGIRLSIYWAPSEKAFETGERVRLVGGITDIIKDGPRFKIERYTQFSIFDYMNGDNIGKGNDYRTVHNIDIPYYYVDKNDSPVVKDMPKVFNGTKKEWDEWFEGPYVDGKPSYKNIPELARLVGATISAEDFKQGWNAIEGKTYAGHYKVFFEPIIFPVINGVDMVMTSRDAIKWEEKYLRGEISNTNGRRITSNIPQIFTYLANSQFLIEDESAIAMKANKPVYKVEYNGTQADREEIRKQIQKGGKIYSSMGVGVVTPDVPKTNNGQLVEVYVKVAGVNLDGSLKYEQISTKVSEVEVAENNAVKLEEVKEIESGVALLNDVILSTNLIVESSASEVSWIDKLPRTNKKALAPTVEDVVAYLLGKNTREVVEIATKTYTNKPELEDAVVYFNEYLAAQTKAANALNQLEKEFWTQVAARAYLRAAMLVRFEDLNFEGFTPAELREIMRVQIQMEYKDAQKIVDSAALITDLNDIYFGKYISGKFNVKEKVKAELNKEVKAVYARYIVVPKTKQVNFIKQYKDNVLVGTQTIIQDLPVAESISEGKYSYTTNINDLSKEDAYKDAKVMKWGTSKEIPLLKEMPSNPIKSGAVLASIEGLETEENLYVEWKMELWTDTGKAPISNTVPEWRLSMYNPSLGYKNKAFMGLSLKADEGHAVSTLSPSGSYNYNTLNPNGKKTVQGYDPSNATYKSWLHSKAQTQGTYTISHSKPSVLVDITGDANYLKSTEIAGLSVASWTANTDLKHKLKLHGIDTANKGALYAGETAINKSEILKFGIENKNSYNHNYGVYYHYSCSHSSADGGSWSHDVCACYTRSETPTPSYITADYNVNITFSRYKQENTDSRKLAVSAKKTEQNGKTTVSKQEATTLNIYPEYPMLFQDDSGNSSIVFAVSDIARKIQPVSFHSLKYTAFTKPTVTNMTVTDSRAKAKAAQIGLGKAPVILKGAPLNATFDVKKAENSTEKGILTVKTFALDINPTVKADWGNAVYDTNKLNSDFLDKFNNFKGIATEQLLIATTPEFIGPKVQNQLQYAKKGNTSTKEHDIIVRGGVLTHVDGTAIATVKANNPELYEALVGMKLVGTTKADTVFNTFEHQQGATLTEKEFKNLARAARNGIDNLELNKGWYSEDATTLIVKEFTTIYELPSSFFADKVPMTVKGLETPINKQQFFSKMVTGHFVLNYTIESSDFGAGIGKVKSFMEHNSKTGSSFGKATKDYGVGNTSTLDSFGF